MKDEAAAKGGRAHIGYNKVTGTIQLTVPNGVKLAELLKDLSLIDVSELAKLPRGCQTCLSGHPFDIRELFDPVIDVRLGR